MHRHVLCAALLLAPALAWGAGGGMSARITEQFRRADTDGNGALSRAEADQAAPLLAKRFDAIDANGDGQISPEEIRASRRAARAGRRAKGGLTFEHYFVRADSDADGVLSRAEAGRSLPRIAKKFDRIDRDGDGRLTRDELQAWLAARRAARAGKAVIHR